MAPERLRRIEIGIAVMVWIVFLGMIAVLVFSVFSRSTAWGWKLTILLLVTAFIMAVIGVHSGSASRKAAAEGRPYPDWVPVTFTANTQQWVELATWQGQRRMAARNNRGPAHSDQRTRTRGGAE